MGDTRKIVLHDKEFKKRAVDAVWGAPDGYEVIVRPQRRSTDQNAKFHAICSDMERAGFVWAGKRRRADEIKVLLVSAHAAATVDTFKVEPEIIYGLEGEKISLRESTARMSVRRSSSLIEYAVAFCAQNGIRLGEKYKLKPQKEKVAEAVC